MWTCLFKQSCSRSIQPIDLHTYIHTWLFQLIFYATHLSKISSEIKTYPKIKVKKRQNTPYEPDRSIKYTYEVVYFRTIFRSIAREWKMKWHQKNLVNSREIHLDDFRALKNNLLHFWEMVNWGYEFYLCAMCSVHAPRPIYSFHRTILYVWIRLNIRNRQMETASICVYNNRD